MKLLVLNKKNKQTLGVKTNKGVIDIEQSLIKFPNDKVKTDIMDIINKGDSAISILKEYIDALPDEGRHLIDEENVDWGPSLTNPSKIICVGLNYRKHADETNAPYPETPILFNKYNNTLTGNKKDIIIPEVTQKLDYEVELGIVIGKKTKNISKEDALDHVFGYTTSNDLSARDLQFVSSQWLLGKSCDGFSPIGPYIVTRDEVSDPNKLSLKTKRNGELKQNSNTSDMIFSCEEIISYISKHMTLIPGDLILTGTPEGVILGEPENKQEYIKSGENITVEIEKIGSLSNNFIEE